MTSYVETERQCLQRLADILTLERPPSGRRKNDGPAEIVGHLYVGSALDATDRRLLNRLRITHVLNCTSAETIGDYDDVGYCRPSNDHCRNNESKFSPIMTLSALSGSSSYFSNDWLKKPSYDTSATFDYRLTSTQSLGNGQLNKWRENGVPRGPDGNPYDPSRSTVRFYLEIGADDTLVYPIIGRHYQTARRFIDSARDSGGRALIHCELGINRSTTLALAYLLDTERLGLIQAVRQLRFDRPNVLSNEGFRRQLIRFAADRHLVDVV